MPVAANAGETTLAELLDSMTREGELYERLLDGKVRCHACAHRCVIFPGKRGICQVRFNRDGKLYVPWGYVAALQCDPIEKKPFYHVLPGEWAMTFGMLGCDFRCSFCQNWHISQTLRDPMKISAEGIVELTKQYDARMVVSSYNEPLITSEWAVEIFKRAKREGLLTGYVSNGNATPEVLDYLKPHLDCYKIDLKTMQDRNYRQLGGVLENVLKTIEMTHERGFWVEVVTLIVPGFNDSEGELRAAAQFIASVSRDIPWHVTAFHPDYKLTDRGGTSPETLVKAAEIGYEEGLHFVYAGNLPGLVGKYENTYCPGCGALLIERYGFYIRQNRLVDGKCPDCGRVIPGIWKPQDLVEAGG
jgi:pyruvate formate lyase activating enzyme